MPVKRGDVILAFVPNVGGPGGKLRLDQVHRRIGTPDRAASEAGRLTLRAGCNFASKLGGGWRQDCISVGGASAL